MRTSKKPEQVYNLSPDIAALVVSITKLAADIEKFEGSRINAFAVSKGDAKTKKLKGIASGENYAFSTYVDPESPEKKLSAERASELKRAFVKAYKNDDIDSFSKAVVSMIIKVLDFKTLTDDGESKFLPDTNSKPYDALLSDIIKIRQMASFCCGDDLLNERLQSLSNDKTPLIFLCVEAPALEAVNS